MSILALSLAFALSLLSPSANAFVIAPPWANATLNPCSEASWQLILWPGDQRCYKIFEQGPCPRSQELAFDGETREAVCRCPKDLLFWPATDRYVGVGRNNIYIYFMGKYPIFMLPE